MFAQLYQALGDYKKIAHPDVEVGEPYALVPKEASDGIKLQWNAEWANSKRSGVYVILSADETVLYIGKAWFIGRRLGDHFRKGPQGECTSPKGYRWSKPPVYVITIAVPEDKRFMATCLEEYLIEKLRPLDNTMGMKWTGSGSAGENSLSDGI